MLPAERDGRENTLFEMQCKCSDTNVVTVLASEKKVRCDVASRAGWQGKYCIPDVVNIIASSEYTCTSVASRALWQRKYLVPNVVRM